MAISTCRTRRKTEEHFPGHVSTREGVAPGTYANTHNEPKKPPNTGVVPFHSMQEKVLCPNTSASAYTPGPGAYGSKDVDRVGHGHTAMKVKSPRMAPTAPGSSIFLPSTIEKNPGPGSYASPKSALEPTSTTELAKPVKPILEVGDKTAPSIPIRRLLPGSKPEVNPAAEDAEVSALVMRHTGEPRDMVGPGEYTPAGEHIVVASAPQTTFYASKLNRKLWEPSVAIDCKFAPRENPGPGSYEPVAGMADQQEIVAESYQFSSKSAMAHQMEIPEKSMVPGPGKYEKVGHIDRASEAAKRHGLFMGDRSRFGAFSERAGWSRDLNQPFTDQYHVYNVPGPGHYPDAGAFSSTSKINESEKSLPPTGRKNVRGVHHPALLIALHEAQGPLQAFNTTDDRDCNRAVEQQTPAPGEYNVDEFRANSIMSRLKDRAKVGRKGAFGTCADRFYGSPLEGRAGLPDPGMDFTINTGENTSHKDPKYMFQSQTPRFNEGVGPREVNASRVGSFQTPAPGDYMIEKEPSYRSPYRQPRKDHLSFGSSAHRFNGSKDLFVGQVGDLNNPGPGEYIDKSRNRPCGAAKVGSARPSPRVGCTTEAVGPGSYNTDVTTLLKKTKNVSTDNGGGHTDGGASAASARRIAKGKVL
eukprot:TRINITY_DN37458_c0_g1_i1.p1 TRINITY_DN37458_c0_g1~~TRINITY_DN37458_c0_g1_i1.p1  ORF type:complete len:673 (+),score=109.74 TRINITY_DN37458_c0_g1_i1:96-2021(+)